jgi:hypothetical protein
VETGLTAKFKEEEYPREACIGRIIIGGAQWIKIDSRKILFTE